MRALSLAMTGFRRSNAVKISSLSEINSQNAILLTRLPKVFNDRYWLNFSTAAVPFDEKEELMRTAATVSQSLINPNDDGSNKSSIWTPRMTKIVGTIGPSSEQLPVLQQLVDSGLRIMRLNFSHATVEEVELRMKNLKLCKK